MNKTRPGFSFIEVIVYVGIFFLLIGLGFSMMQRPKPGNDRDMFIARLNTLIGLSWKHSIQTGSMQRISWNLIKRTVTLATEADNANNKENEPTFKPLSTKFGVTEIAIPKTIKIEQFFIEGFDEIGKYKGSKNSENWFYLAPNGLTQEVTINILDLKDTLEKKPRPFGLVLNPFNAQFEVYDSFQ